MDRYTVAHLEEIDEVADGRCLCSLVGRGLSGVQLVVSDAHAGLKKAIAQVLG